MLSAAILAAATLMAPAAVSVAIAYGPAGGYRATTLSDRLHGLAARFAPSRWLRASSRAFQALMDKLAERGAQTGGVREGEAAAPPPPAGTPPNSNGPYVEERPQGGVEERPQGGEEERPRGGPGKEPWGSSSGGEARGAGRYYSPRAARVKPWRQRWSPACGNAGPARSSWYAVQPGDTLWTIAEMHYGYGGAYHRILSANRSIVDPGLIYPCQCLIIPHW